MDVCQVDASKRHIIDTRPEPNLSTVSICVVNNPTALYQASSKPHKFCSWDMKDVNVSPPTGTVYTCIFSGTQLMIRTIHTNNNNFTTNNFNYKFVCFLFVYLINLLLVTKNKLKIFFLKTP